MVDVNERQVLELTTKAGKILLESGAEVFRVEETMRRIAKHYGVDTAEFVVIGNAIIATCGAEGKEQRAKIQHIPVSSARLDKVVAVNQLSREIEQGKYTCSQAWKELGQIDCLQKKSAWVRIFFTGIGSACFCALLKATILDCIVVFFISALVHTFMLTVSERHMSKIVGNLCTSILATLTCIICCELGIGKNLSNMVVGAIIQLIPGVALTNGIRDMTGGDYISGSVRMLDALFAFISIAIGVGVTFALCQQFAARIFL